MIQKMPACRHFLYRFPNLNRNPAHKNKFFRPQVRRSRAAKATHPASKSLPAENFFHLGHKVFSQQYVTCINSGLNVTEQRDRPK